MDLVIYLLHFAHYLAPVAVEEYDMFPTAALASTMTFTSRANWNEMNSSIRLSEYEGQIEIFGGCGPKNYTT